jgi:hypothetical protein
MVGGTEIVKQFRGEVIRANERFVGGLGPVEIPIFKETVRPGEVFTRGGEGEAGGTEKNRED